MDPISQQAVTEILWPTLLFGVVVAMFGWTLYWTGLHVIGAALGGAAGAAGALFGASLMDVAEQTRYLIIGGGGLLGAVLGVLLMRAIQFYFFFLLGACLGGPAAYSALKLEALASQPWAATDGGKVGMFLAGAAAGGVIAILGRRYIISLLTAAIGSAAIALSLPTEHQEWIALGCFVFSFGTQAGLTRKFVPKHRVDRATRRRRD